MIFKLTHFDAFLSICMVSLM